MLFLLIIIVCFIILAIVIIPKMKKKNHNHASPLTSTNQRTAFRLYFQDVPCKFQTALSSTRYTGIVRDLSITGMRLETEVDIIQRKSVLLVYFELDEELFALECIVKRKQQKDATTMQYGLKFINVPTQVNERLYKLLWEISRNRVR